MLAERRRDAALPPWLPPRFDAKVAELPPGVAEAFKKPAAVWPSQDHNIYDDYNNDDDDDNDRNYTSHHGDYTACDKECGYCGSCDY